MRKNTTKITRQESFKNFLDKDLENEFAPALNIFDRMSQGIETLMNIFAKNGENNLNRRLNEKEADDFLKRFSK